MDANSGGLGRDVETATHLLVGVVGDESKLDGATLPVGQLGEGGRQVVVEAVAPGIVGAGGDRLQGVGAPGGTRTHDL